VVDLRNITTKRHGEPVAPRKLDVSGPEEFGIPRRLLLRNQTTYKSFTILTVFLPKSKLKDYHS
jgi:hypothetical protein